jgi:hypothetical protein
MDIKKTIFFYYYLSVFISIPLISCLFVECFMNTIYYIFFGSNISQIQKINITMFITFYVYFQIYIYLVFNNYLNI